MPHQETARSSATSSTHTIHDALSRPQVDDEEKKVEVQEKHQSEVAADLATAAEAIEGTDAQYEEHPDGGTRAWMVVLGVSGSTRSIHLPYKVLT